MEQWGIPVPIEWPDHVLDDIDAFHDRVAEKCLEYDLELIDEMTRILDALRQSRAATEAQWRARHAAWNKPIRTTTDG